MERIASFTVDHTKLKRGVYLSRQDGDVMTWDVRMKEPNKGDYLSTGALHTIEHLFATYVRFSTVSYSLLILWRLSTGRFRGRARKSAATIWIRT